MKKIFVQLLIQQSRLFYIYNLIIPLLLPTFLIMLLGPDQMFGLNEFGLVIAQWFLYSIIMLGTNIGTLHVAEDISAADRNYNTAGSICLLILSITFLLCSFNICGENSSDIPKWLFNIKNILLGIAAIISVYFTLLLVSKNSNIYFGKQNLAENCIKREENIEFLEGKLDDKEPEIHA